MKFISVFSCLLYTTCTGGTDIEIEGFEGKQVSFQCSHTLAWKNNKYLCNNSCKDSDILVTVRSGGTAQSGRIILEDSGDGCFTVTFDQLQLSDSGIYRCAVDRIGFDTFIVVNLTVKKEKDRSTSFTTASHTAVAYETTAVTSDVYLTWTYQNVSSSTQLISETGTSSSVNLSSASNYSNGGRINISTRTVLYSTGGAIAILIVLVVLALSFRKHREISKLQVCSNSTDFTNAVEIEQMDYESDDNGDTESIKKLSERASCTHHLKLDPPKFSSTATERSESLHIYENLCCSRDVVGSRCSSGNVLNNYGIPSRIIRPSPSISEKTSDGCVRKRTDKCTAMTEYCDPTESKPGSLWFGLDLSGAL